VPTVKSRIPETENFRRTRDAWARDQGSRLDSKVRSIDGRLNPSRKRNARRKQLAWGHRRGFGDPGAFETIGQSGAQIEYETGKGQAFILGKDPIEVAGIGAALAKITEPFMRAVLRETDKQVAAAALDIWRDWPVYSGGSRSSLALAWGQASEGVEVRFASLADYTFKNASTSSAWASARKRWAQIAPNVGSAIRVSNLGTESGNI